MICRMAACKHRIIAGKLYERLHSVRLVLLVILRTFVYLHKCSNLSVMSALFFFFCYPFLREPCGSLHLVASLVLKRELLENKGLAFFLPTSSN